MQAFKCLFPTLMLFTLLDFLWLGVIGKSLYMNHLSSVLLLSGQTITPRVLPTITVYLLFAIMIWFIVLPLAKNEVLLSFGYGALLGLVVYGIYDMTNLAVLEAWTETIAIIDCLWGMFLCSMTSGFCAFIKTSIAPL